MFTSNIDRYVCSPPSLFHPAYAKYPGSAYESWYCFTENVSPPLVWLEYWLEYIAIVKQEVLSGQCSVFLKVRSWKRLVLIESTPGSSAPVSSRIRESDFHYFSIFHKLIPPFPPLPFSLSLYRSGKEGTPPLLSFLSVETSSSSSKSHQSRPLGERGPAAYLPCRLPSRVRAFSCPWLYR